MRVVKMKLLPLGENTLIQDLMAKLIQLVSSLTKTDTNHIPKQAKKLTLCTKRNGFLGLS
ncbi:hypothetical protein BDFB_000455 [Asbolus verrucosus]|uniref:Uncharacterized protein n=1 Tax=Asbolus verrucosus TaxID=1661398 RepID=A0A482VPL6_ASBVE|nr:hypothetical protein BDFB_000455 [Asbolus verrucosus]